MGDGSPAGQAPDVDLPYFDPLLTLIERSQNSPLWQPGHRHVHWGLHTPATADHSAASCQLAMEAMTEKVCTAGRVADGLRILDVGCGFGGTINHLNERLTGCELVGLNIDERQLAVARQEVQARPTNTVRFVQGDACALPFKENTFDVVTAVECIFHFPSRKRFFSEARRVLRDGGTLMVSDFVIPREKADEMDAWLVANASNNTFSGVKTYALCTGTYDRMAASSGFRVLADEDVTAETMPSYPTFKTLLAEAGLPDGVKAIAYLEDMSVLGFYQYRIMSFEATPRSAPTRT